MINIQMNKYSMEYKVGLLKAYFVFSTILGIYFPQSWEFIFHNLGNFSWHMMLLMEKYGCKGIDFMYLKRLIEEKIEKKLK